MYGTGSSEYLLLRYLFDRLLEFLHSMSYLFSTVPAASKETNIQARAEFLVSTRNPAVLVLHRSFSVFAGEFRQLPSFKHLPRK